MSREPKARLIAEILQALRTTDAEMDRIEEHAAQALGVHRTDLRCMEILSRGRPLTAGEVAAATGLTSGAATALLDRLESRGYVRRVRDKRDRRKILIEVTPAARGKVAPVFARLMASAQDTFALFTRDELETVLKFLNRNRAVVFAHLEHLQRPWA